MPWSAIRRQCQHSCRNVMVIPIVTWKPNSFQSDSSFDVKIIKYWYQTTTFLCRHILSVAVSRTRDQGTGVIGCRSIENFNLGKFYYNEYTIKRKFFNELLMDLVDVGALCMISWLLIHTYSYFKKQFVIKFIYLQW